MKKGFTLMEIICVLAVLSIIALISSPSLKGYMRKDRLRLSTERLVNDLRFAKMEAMSKDSQQIYVMFERKAGEQDFNGYWIYDQSRLSDMTLKRVKLPEGVVICRRLDGSTFNVDNKIIFTPEGGILPFACTVALKDLDTGEKRFITLTIGFTRIMEVDR